MASLNVPELGDMVYYKEDWKIPTLGGVYSLYGKESDECLYVGKTDDLRERLANHFMGKETDTGGLYWNFYRCRFAFEQCPMYRDMWETYYINTLFPKFNKRKAFLYEPKPIMYYKHVLHSENLERYYELRCTHIKANGERCHKRKYKAELCTLHYRLMLDKTS